MGRRPLAGLEGDPALGSKPFAGLVWDTAGIRALRRIPQALVCGSSLALLHI